MIERTECEIMNNWKGDRDDPVVSICCIAYNHEKYIADALDSFLMQETDFPFEIIIDDDCSTDATAAVIKMYAEAYPTIVKANLRQKNVGLYENFLSNATRAVGTYIAMCEGDDYWIDKDKLQMQFDAMDCHPGCSFSGHDVNLVNIDKNIIRKHSVGRINERWETHVVTSDEALSTPWSIPHTTALFYRRKYFDAAYFHALKNNLGFDYLLFVLLCSKGNMYYIGKVMSAWRRYDTSFSGSWIYGYNEVFMQQVIEAHHRIDAYFGGRYHKGIDIHLNGQYMIQCEQQLQMSIEKKQYVEALKNLFCMIRHSKNHPYGIRDILWIFRSKLAVLRSEHGNDQ